MLVFACGLLVFENGWNWNIIKILGFSIRLAEYCHFDRKEKSIDRVMQ